MQETKFYNKYIWFLAGLILFHLFFNATFINLNKAPLPWDQANHTRLSVLIERCLQEKTISKTNCLSISDYYPIFTHTFGALFFTIFGENIMAGQFLGSFFLVFNLIFAFLYLRKLFNNERNAFFAVLIYSFFPVIFNSSRYIWLEIPLLMNLFASMYFLLKSKGMKIPGFTILAFVFAGFATMTKWYAPVYLLVPFVFELINGYKNTHRKGLVMNFVIGTALFLLIIAPWYGTNFQNIVDRTIHFSIADPSQPGSIFSIESITWYLQSAVKHQMGPILFAIGVICAGIFFFTYENKKIKWFLVAQFVVIYVIFSAIGNKDLRFTFLFIAYFSYFISHSIGLLSKEMQVLAKVILIGWMLFFFTVFTFGFPIKQSYAYFKELPGFGYVNIINFTDYPVEKPNTNTYPMDEMVQTINSLGNEKQIRVLALFDYPRLNGTNLNLHHIVEYPENTQNVIIVSFEPGENFNPGIYASEFDYILVTTHESSGGYYRFKPQMDETQNYVLNSNYPILSRFKLPIEDIQKYIVSSAPEELISNRKEACGSTACDEILLVKVE